MNLTNIVEIIKAALNLGLIFLDILDSVTTMYKELMEQFKSQYIFAEEA